MSDAKAKMDAKKAKLGIKKVPASVQLLDVRLTSFDEEIRRQAYTGLSKLDAPEEPLVEKIVEKFDHENWYVREAAYMAIGYCVEAGCGELAGRSIAGHLEHEDPHIRFCAGRALLAVEDRVRVKLEDLKNPMSKNSAKGDPAIIAQATVAAEQAAGHLAARLDHTDPKIRQNALDALSRMGQYCIPHAINMCNMVLDPNLSVRNELVRVIERLGVILVEGVAKLASCLAEPQENMRRSGTRCLLELMKTCGPEVAQGVADMLKHESRITKMASLEFLAQMGHLAADHGSAMADMLEEPDAEVRLTAVRAMISAGKAMGHHLKDIKPRTLHPNPDVSRAAIKTLRGLAPLCPKVAKAAFKDLEEDPDDVPICTAAIQVLAGAAHNVTPYLDEVAKALEDKDWGLRRAAIEALADLKEHAVPAGNEVARRLLHHDPDVRRAAVEALGRMGVHAGEFGHRVEGLGDTEEDPDVNHACKVACGMLWAAGMAKR